MAVTTPLGSLSHYTLAAAVTPLFEPAPRHKPKRSVFLPAETQQPEISASPSSTEFARSQSDRRLAVLSATKATVPPRYSPPLQRAAVVDADATSESSGFVIPWCTFDGVPYRVGCRIRVLEVSLKF
ncbi:hypothetical protein BKA93DRAFT_826821 [Sparassis latifolia]